MRRDPQNKTVQWLRHGLLAAMWAAILIGLIVHRKDLTVSEILEFTPANPWAAVFFLLCLFVLKSVSIVIYSGILFAASGILFPLPAAILVNLLGVVIMVTIPYFIGKHNGVSAVERILNKYPKASQLRQQRQENNFLFVLFVRMLRILPCDVVSLYMGAINMKFGSYLMGSFVGILPSAISFAVMGMSITDINSPQFMIALCVEILCIAASIILYQINKKGRKSEHE